MQTEAQAIQTAVSALQGKQPDAALQSRIQRFSSASNTANQELGRQEQTLRSTQQHVVQQINQRLGPIINGAAGRDRRVADRRPRRRARSRAGSGHHQHSAGRAQPAAAER